ncbi:hypothetical protein RFI_14049 [Reticulomyxa filosa]|uniref:FAD/NAD(P)-binding domain-containing protein n=1 Tax=Reticulomyxa filosa TaxID=46433 RepID=X6NCT8_RETFI|nr:hypothetical protein RFI_14049 [Reticulomyxa filosa]|eukprot:ETO23137.1 hypothetical protein RFI_14049 [Reticulomyxa filosa]
MAVAALILRKQLVAKASDITVFEKSATHYYQPAFTMVSGGLLGSKEEDVVRTSTGLVHRPAASVFDEQINLVPDEITEFDPNQNKVMTSNGKSYTYDYLIVACGNKLRYDLVEGAVDALNDPQSGVGSMYDFTYAKKINQLRANFKGGKIIATQPPMPIKCAGAPQKWVYLCEEAMRNELHQTAVSKAISPHFEYDVTKVDDQKKKVHFKKIGSKASKNEVIIESYDMLHLVPPQRPHESVAKASFSNDAGYVDVHKYTLQSTRFENVFSLGDCSSLPTSRTAAAVFAQSPILVHNLEKVMTGNKHEIKELYDGYASCPIFVGDKKLILAEFLYDGQISETFGRFVDQRTPRMFFYYLKRYIFPYVYWNYVPRAQWFGRDGFMPPAFFSSTSSNSTSGQKVKKNSH